MDSKEYLKLSEIEKDHWYYRGKRSIIKDRINRLASLSRDDLLIDVGSGAGIFVEEMSSCCLAYGIDSSLFGLELGSRLSKKSLAAGDIANLPIKDGSASIVTAMDILEHVKEDRRAMEELSRITKKGGLIFITVPAYKFLMSGWDRSLGHFRRYSLNDFRALLEGLPVKILDQRYINNALFFPIMLYRLLGKNVSRKGGWRLEDIQLPPVFNSILHCLFLKSATLRFRIPFGLSILVILRKY